MNPSGQVLLVELNEINFDYMKVYADRGDVPNLAHLMSEHGVSETVSETEFNELEPWIQWVTAHTGLSYAEHKVYRLGDISKHDFMQIWEWLEAHGLLVGAISPMNARNRLQKPAFFVPDPWTAERLSAGPLLARLFNAIVQAVNDNAHDRVTAKSLFWLLTGLARYARSCNYSKYAKLGLSGRKEEWRRAMFLDLLLADVFIREVQRAKPDFASLFLNAGAHIQHHYLFNSAAYAGNSTNPEWYVTPETDPVGDVYRLYDEIIGQVLTAFPRARLMVATGLHQDPHSGATFYWRLKNHAAFLRRIGVQFKHVKPRMSRDFVVECESREAATSAACILESVESNGRRIFEVDNRGQDLFVTLIWPHDIGPEFSLELGDARYPGFRDEVAFVAIKNGQHNSIGYFIDTGSDPVDLDPTISLKDLPVVICDALGVERMTN